MEVVVILHNIRSAHNAGSIFRTADAAGIKKIYLTGYTPGPLDARGMLRRDFTKVSLGAEHTVPYSRTKTLVPLLRRLKKEGYEILALELDHHAVSLFTYKPKNKKVAIILGNEVSGLSPATLKHADKILEIPMRGTKESLNVSVAAGIALFTLLKN